MNRLLNIPFQITDVESPKTISRVFLNASIKSTAEHQGRALAFI